ncbi:MAG: DUF3341 domain-containing protein [Bdellovibrionales bacterium]|nr:DUF3341 domain-containing protein [Bdellovibrionales bacterium]
MAKPYCILASFDSPAALIQAAEKTRDAGYKHFDCYSPFPIHGMDAAMGLKRSPLGLIAAGGAFGGLATAALMQWWMSAVDYPLVLSGKPFFSYQAFVPIAFELTILGAALAAVFGMFALNQMPQYHHPVFESDKLLKTSSDNGFVLAIESSDPAFSTDGVEQFMKDLGAAQIEHVAQEEEGEHV